MIHRTKRICILFLLLNLIFLVTYAQIGQSGFSHADTLRGSLNSERLYNVIRYDLTFSPDYHNKTIRGVNTITYTDSGLHTMQIDLQEPLIIDSIVSNNRKLHFSREGNAFHIELETAAVPNNVLTTKAAKKISIYYHGHPQISERAPWDGGFIFTSDSLGRPWMSVACQGKGASVWYPCKDYLGDEPDSGASLTIIVPDSLSAIGNGRLIKKAKLSGGLTSWTWQVVNPINNYNIIPYIGKYAHWHQLYFGQKGNLDCDFWVMDYNLQKAKKYFTEVDSMLSCFELWFGPYPFYEDSYKLIESSYPGMEHQSAIAYGNHYRRGYDGIDLSGTGWGLKWDYIIVHESGHEWFGNNISCKDVADEWIHESFTAYSETLFTGNYFGKNAGDAYCIGIRKNILNKEPIIGYYGVNKEPPDNDLYHKGSNMIHTIRQVIHNDETFRRILRGLNEHFYHQTVTSEEIQDYINKISGINFTPVFNQYLRSTSIPVLEYKLEDNLIEYRWANCNADFDMPIRVDIGGERWLKPTTVWKNERIHKNANNVLQVDKNFYVLTKNISDKP